MNRRPMLMYLKAAMFISHLLIAVFQNLMAVLQNVMAVLQNLVVVLKNLVAVHKNLVAVLKNLVAVEDRHRVLEDRHRVLEDRHLVTVIQIQNSPMVELSISNQSLMLALQLDNIHLKHRYCLILILHQILSFTKSIHEIDNLYHNTVIFVIQNHRATKPSMIKGEQIQFKLGNPKQFHRDTSLHKRRQIRQAFELEMHNKKRKESKR